MIEIQKSETADTRTCDFANVSKETLLASSKQHISDVGQALTFFRDEIYKADIRHDTDKLTDIDGFHADFVTGFKQTGWWDRHRQLNRHHLLQPDGVPDDVNLIDVLDMIADCVMAGMARSGSVYPLEIPAEVLKAAFDNTVDLLKRQVVVASSPSEECDSHEALRARVLALEQENARLERSVDAWMADANRYAQNTEHAQSERDTALQRVQETP